MVSCLYGTSSSTLNQMTPTSAKIMTVTSSINTTQGCSRIYAYKGNTLSDDMTNTSPFDASFRCGSRATTSGQSLPYRISIGSNVSFLNPDTINALGIGFVSEQTSSYTFSGTTDVTCAVKVGDGYSTNNSCRVSSCVGSDCARPQTFIVTPSNNVVCTRAPNASYDIGCNEASPDYTQCVNWFYENTPRTIQISGVSQPLICTLVRSVKTCTVNLPTGGFPVTIFAGDTQSFQTTVYTLTHDSQPPQGTLSYYTNYGSRTLLDTTQSSFWQRQPVTAAITCTDMPGISDGSDCACAATLYEPT